MAGILKARFFNPDLAEACAKPVVFDRAQFPIVVLPETGRPLQFGSRILWKGKYPIFPPKQLFI